MDPTTAMLLFMGGSAAQAYSQYREGKSEEEAYKANADIAAREGLRAEKVSQEQALEKQKEAKRLLAEQIVRYAKSGFKPGIGTPLTVQDYTQGQMTRQAQILLEQGQYAKEYGFSMAKLYKKMGKSAARRGLWRAGTTLATTLGQVGLMTTTYGSGKGSSILPTGSAGMP